MITPRYFMACDPDSKNSAYAVIDLEGELKHAFVIKAKDGKEHTNIREHAKYEFPFKAPFISLVEGQKLYRGDKKSNPESLIKLARISGINSYWISSQLNCISLDVVLPQEWGGTVEKHIKQRRMIESMGLTPVRMGGKTPYTVPKEDLMGLKATELKHVIDAICMAHFLRNRYLAEKRKKEILGR